MENDLSFGAWLQRRRKRLDLTQAATAGRCRGQDGTPLALELTAARVSALGVVQIAAALDAPNKGGR